MKSPNSATPSTQKIPEKSRKKANITAHRAVMFEPKAPQKAKPIFHSGKKRITASPLQKRRDISPPFQVFQTSFAVFIRTPGPMVAAATQLRIYWPLAAAGLAFTMAPIRVL